MEARIFWSVVLALCVFSGLGAVVRAVAQHQQDADAEEASRLAFVEISASAQAARQLSIDDPVQRQKRWSMDYNSRVLQDNMRCVGGTVVLVKGHDYEQVGGPKYPVHCVNRMADRPIRTPF